MSSKNKKPEGLQSVMSAAPAAAAATPPAETWTVNGTLVSSLPPAIQAGIPYSITDQYLAEREGLPKARVQVIRSAEQKDLDEFEFVAHRKDPMERALDPVKQPGKHYRFLSPEHRGGRRDYEIVKDPKTGEPVRYRTMVLGEVPKRQAQAHERHFIEEAHTDLRRAVEGTKLDQERAIRDSRSGDSISVLRDGESLSNFETPSPDVSIGVTHTRGLQGAGAV